MRIYFEDKDINKGNLILVNADHAYRGLWEAAQPLGLSYMQEAEPILLKEPAACSLLMLLRRIAADLGGFTQGEWAGVYTDLCGSAGTQ